MYMLSVLRICYISIIRIYSYKIIINPADLALHKWLIRQWDVDYETKRTKQQEHSSFWLGGLNQIEEEWKMEQIKLSNNEIKSIVRLLLEKYDNDNS